MKKHRLDNGDYPYENGHMNGECAIQQNYYFLTTTKKKVQQAR